ncbi:MAG: hypothetical protein LW809_02115 [Vampirovibrionales bacterium]|jgi:hypothetical protein|nr:hypothetical protein [Vampirovibrionales bacterium]
MMKNAFQLPDSFKFSPLPTKDAPASSIFEEGSVKLSKPLTKALNLLDTQTTDGLSVHLRSPALKRRYWQRQHAKEYDRLNVLSTHADWIRQTLEDRGCHSLKNSFDRDMIHLEQLQGMYARLQVQEERMLNPFETWLFKQERQFQNQFKAVRLILENAFSSLVSRGENGIDVQGQRLLQQWVFQLCQRHREKGLSPDLVQDVYILQQRSPR